MKLRVFLSPRQVGILTYGYPLSITGFVSLGEARHSWHKKTGSQNPSLHLLFTVLARDFLLKVIFENLQMIQVLKSLPSSHVSPLHY